MNGARDSQYGAVVLGILFNCYSTLMGFNTVYYAPRRRRLMSVWWLKWYALLMNVITLGMLGLYDYNTLALHDFMDQRLLQRYILVVMMSEMSLAIVYALVTRCARQRHLLLILEVLQQTRQQSTQQPRTVTAYYLNRLLSIKIVVIVVHTLVVIIAHFIFYSVLDWQQSILLIAMNLNLLAVSYGMLLPFFVLLWYIAQRFNAINTRLALRPTTLSAIWQLYNEHVQLNALTARLYACYKWLIAWLLVHYFMSVVTLGYHAIYVLTRKSLELAYESLLLNCSVYLLYIVDLYVLESLCERVTLLSEEASLLMRRYAELQTSMELTPSAAQCCDWFALHLSWRRLSIALFDQFTVNRSQTFFMVSQIFLHTIFIVQSDYRNLMKN